MNKVILIGNLTRDPEIRTMTGENATVIARFTLAVQRQFKNADGKREADFINCVSFGKQSEFIEKYFKKGNKAAIVGHIQTGSYKNKDGATVYTTDVVVENIEFVGSKNSEGNGNTPEPTGNQENMNSGFMDIPESADDEGLPFN